MINKVILIGNLGKDPEIKTFENGGSVARITVATNENYKDKEGNWKTQTEWHNVIVWNRDISKLKKGALVFVEGKLTTRSYKDANDVDRNITEIVASTCRPLAASSGNTSNAPLPDDAASYETHENSTGIDDLPF